MLIPAHTKATAMDTRVGEKAEVFFMGKAPKIKKGLSWYFQLVHVHQPIFQFRDFSTFPPQVNHCKSASKFLRNH
jgi:hypothetical protein